VSSLLVCVCVCDAAVGNKLLMLFFPFLRKWTYARMHEQVGTLGLCVHVCA
jgi:hypothetical protein